MSYLLPKRISELATIDSDLDTPDKRTESKNSYRLPKRVAELDLPESDSEDDRNDRLNCAILNDSFIISPTKRLNIDESPTQQSFQPIDENKNTVNHFTSSQCTDSGIVGSQKRQEETPQFDDHLKIYNRPLKSRTQLFASKSVLQERTSENSVPLVFQKSSRDESDAGKAAMPRPRKIAAESQEHQRMLESSLKVPDLDTPFKSKEQHHFVTPSLRPNPYTFSTTANRSQNLPTAERKDKPQAKILFTTPIARPPPGSLVEKTPIIPITQRKLSPIKEPSNEKEKPEERTITINNVDYIIDKKIGSGGSSSVFLARGKYSGKEFAIKLVNLNGDQQVVEGYLNETKLLAKLQGNVCVVSLFDYCHLPQKNILYMVMEKGESDLHKTLQGFRTHIPLYTLISYWYQMLQAVNYIHQNGVIHSDLKPANFLMIGGRLKLIDFGIASNISIDSTSIIKFSQAGTFNYISPEALIDTSSGDSPSTHHQPKIRLSTKSDVWSLGCIFYLLLFKKTPFSHIKVIHQKITVLTNPNTVIEYPEMPNFYPPILVEIVRQCLVYNPKERSSVADLLKFPFSMMIPIE